MNTRFRTALLTMASATLIVGAAAPGLAHETHGTGHHTGHHAGHHHDHAGPSPRARHQLARLRVHLRRYRDPAAAVAAGWIPTDACSALPDGSAGMGFHYVNPGPIAGPPDPMHPPILVYVPTRGGGRTLGAAEWFVPDADQDLATDDDRPSLFGVEFDGPMEGHEPGMPIHYDLHAWLLRANPDGVLAPWNPRVSC